MMLRAALFIPLVGCYSPAYQDCAISCAQSGLCPSGLECVAGACLAPGGMCGMTDDAPPSGSWQFRKKVTLGRAPAVTSFPVLVRLENDPDLANFAQDTGGDIKFTTLDGGQLAHEIERFVESTGELAAWIKLPALSSTVPTDIYMYYGYPDARDQQAPTDVWDANYVGVWHLSDPPGSTLNDSTANATDGAKAAGNTPSPSAGLIAGGHVYGGGPNELYSIGSDPAKLDLAAVTFEAWINRDGTGGTAVRRVLDAPSSFTRRLVVAYFDEDVAGAGAHLLVQIPMIGANSSVRRLPLDTSTVASWMHVVVTCASPNDPPLVYVNGVLLATTLTSQVLQASNTAVTIGAGQSSSDLSIDATLDEVRLSKVARSAEYVAASYQIQRPDSPFVMVGPAEAAPP